ncbi:MAG TPA: hypothetical protein VHZ95_05785, partial [Polyangiales bacterium]|nr:hypothetical protein [Polyangiales bacterium]
MVSALLARLPACAPQLAALLRAGFAELISPGRTATQNLSRTETLPPPPPRLSMLAEATPRLTPRPDTSRPPRGSRGPRLQLDPGSVGVPIETIPLVERSVWPPAAAVPEDPLREIELALSERLYESSERVRAFVALSQLWQERIGSLEEATRALREAVAADPEDPALMERAALHCFRLGDGELAVRYASASAIATSEARERARRYELIALFERARGRLEPCLEALSEAAAEHPEEPGPHEAMAQLLADRDQLPLAAAHARMAASYYVVRNPERALRLHALAYVWHPTDPQLSSEYADALEWHGQPEAAVAVLAETARNLSGADRRDGLERAARRAELHNRRDLCSELLLEIFAEDPGYSAIHERLATSLDRVGLEAEHAAWLEAIAHHSAAADRPRALARAAEALARVDGEHEASLRHLWHAYRLDESILSSEQLARFAAISGELKSGPPDPIATAQTLEAKLTAADSGEHVALLARLAALHAERGDARGLASACLRLLSIEPTHAMATARLARAALELTDPVLRREALITLGRIRTGREQGRALALLARQLENMADFDSAVTTAEAAL